MNEFPLTIHLRTRFGIWCSLFANPEYSFFFFFFGAQIPPALVPPWTRVHPGILASKQIPYSPFRLALTFLDLHGSSE